MLTFVLPGPLRELAANRSEVRVRGSATSAAEALGLLWKECPAVRDRVITELGEVRPHINIFVDGDNLRDAAGLDTPIQADSEVFIVPAVSGG